MNLFQLLRRCLERFSHRSATDRRMDDEMRMHIEMQALENRTAGMTPDEALRAAYKQFGWVEAVKDVCRDQRRLGLFEDLGRDIRIGVRMLRKNPGFTAVAVLTLALGIGANTAIFTVAYGVLLKPLALPHSERVLSIWERGPEGRFQKVPASAQNYLDWKASAKTFVAMSCWQPVAINVGAEGGPPERWNGSLVHDDYFKVAGVNPEVGSVFSPEHFIRGRDEVAVIGHGVWQERFGGDPNIIGKTVLLNGRSRVVIGVMPPGFQSPALSRVWLPMVLGQQELDDRGFKTFFVLGRINDAATVAQANSEIAGIAANLSKTFPDALDGWSAFAHPALEDVAQPVRLPVMVLAAAVGLVLIMACVNVANLLLARGAVRTGEMALRAAIGAERRHLLRQLSVESLLLAALGGFAGWLFAAGLLKMVIAAAPAGLPRINQVSLDVMALGFTTAAALLTSFLFGFAPAWQLSRVQPVQAIRDSAEQTTSRAGRVSRPLIIFQIAAAMVVLVAAGLLLRSFDRLLQTDLGFQPDELLTARLELPPVKYKGEGRRNRFAQLLIDKLAAAPGVVGVAVSSQLPFQGWPQVIMRVEGQPAPRQSDAPSTAWCGVSQDYFHTLGMALLRGRSFGLQDRADAVKVAIVNESFAKRFFPGLDAVGRRFELGLSDPPRWIEVVGVVRDARTQTVENLPQPEAYVPLAQQDEIFGPSLSVAVRSRPGAPDLANTLRQSVWSIDKDQPLANLKLMNQLLSDSMAQRRFTLILLSVFAGLALLLTIVGLYGVLAYSVSRRRREIGIRMALGAERANVVGLVLREGFWLAAFGIGVGLLGALGAVRVLRNLLYSVDPTDPITFVAVMALLAAAALAACWVPARRAAKVDPILALRSE